MMCAGLTEPLVDFAIGLLSAIITLLSFIGILWSIGGSLNVRLGDTHLSIPAYLVWAAIAYAVVVSAAMLYFGQPLPQRVAERNEGEAKLRFGLMRLRDHGAEIAQTNGEVRERAALMGIYDSLALRWLAMIKRRGRLTWITNGNGVLVPVVPLLLAAPKYLAGDLSLGVIWSRLQRLSCMSRLLSTGLSRTSCALQNGWRQPGV